MTLSKFISLSLLSLTLAACASVESPLQQAYKKPDLSSPAVTGTTASPRLVADGQDVPKGGGRDHVGKSYKISGVTYQPFEKVKGQHQEVGSASWYGQQFHGRKTANGEIFNMHAMSAAHRTMPLPSYARVTNLKNGRSIIVRVNDRGPFAHNRLIDLSSRAADLLDFKREGTAKVKVEYQQRANLAGSNDKNLEMSLAMNTPAEVPNGKAPNNKSPIKAPIQLASKELPILKEKLDAPVKQEPVAVLAPEQKSQTLQSLISRLKPQPLEEDAPTPAVAQKPLKLGSVY